MNKLKNFQYTQENALPTIAMLNVTDDCNLACKYCFVEQHPHYMSLDTAKQAVDWIYSNYLQKQKINKNENKPNINFFGGEPMLMYKKLIVPLIKYIEEKYPDIFSFGITTNCTLLTKESIDFFVKHKIGVLCSIDGAEKTQCYNRPCRNGDNSSKLIESNIKYLLERLPEVTFRATIYAPTVQYLFENYLYAEKLGFKNFAACLDERYKWTNIQIEILKLQLNKIFLYKKIKQMETGECLQLTTYNVLYDYIVNLFKENPENQGNDTVMRCGLGTTSCAIGYDGKIYGCQQNVSLNNKDLFLIGDLVNGIDKDKHIKLLKKYIYGSQMIKYPQNYFKCHNCFLKGYCTNIALSGCPSTNVEIFNNTHKRTKVRCEETKQVFKNLVLSDFIDISLPEEEERG